MHMKLPNSRRFLFHSSSTGFSLIELLAVMSIITLVSAICIPSLSSVKSDIELQACTSDVIGQLSIARQAARTNNRKVEVRFYSDTASAPTIYRSIQLFILSMDGTEARPLLKPFNLPSSISISGSTTFSSLLTLCAKTGTDAKGQYCALQFLSNGTIDSTSTSLPTLTLLPETMSKSSDILPRLFATIQIDPRTGRTLYFHP